MEFPVMPVRSMSSDSFAGDAPSWRIMSCKIAFQHNEYYTDGDENKFEVVCRCILKMRPQSGIKAVRWRVR